MDHHVGGTSMYGSPSLWLVDVWPRSSTMINPDDGTSMTIPMTDGVHNLVMLGFSQVLSL